MENNVPGGGAPMEVDNSSDWAGRDRDWNNSNTASQAVPSEDGTQQASWNHQEGGGNWNSYRGGGASNLQAQPTAPPPPSRASTRPVPFH